MVAAITPPPPMTDTNSDIQLPKPTQSFATTLPSAPVTSARPVWTPAPDCELTAPGTARANLAATASHPHGTTENSYAARHAHRTVVQQHCDYFDADGDGRVWPSDTYRGCRAWGWSPLLAGFVSFVIHVAFSYPTGPSVLPDPCFRIFLDRIHLDKHGSDSMTFDSEGRFIPQRFEDLFAKYDAEGKGGLTWGDIWRFWNEQRMVFDFFGQGATLFEWWLVYLLLWPEDGVMRKEEVRGVFDGSIFYTKAAKQQAFMRQGKGSSSSIAEGKTEKSVAVKS
jgi:peroxygenase